MLSSSLVNMYVNGDTNLKTTIDAYVNPVSVSIIDTGIFDNAFRGDEISENERGIEISNSEKTS